MCRPARLGFPVWAGQGLVAASAQAGPDLLDGEQPMTYLDIRAALGRERQNTLLADARAASTARQARLHRRQAATPARRSLLWHVSAQHHRAVFRSQRAAAAAAEAQPSAR